ncbi:hypothetical protein MRB53_040596 [Persea americana]|nr:hypothetical protein MRB53_040596 [Persea americana]
MRRVLVDLEGYLRHPHATLLLNLHYRWSLSSRQSVGAVQIALTCNGACLLSEQIQESAIDTANMCALELAVFSDCPARGRRKNDNQPK